MTFDSAEDMMKFMADSEDAAIASMTPRQHEHVKVAFTNPTYWFRVWEGLLIVGESQPVEAQARREAELGGDYEYDLERFTERHGRGYLFGKAYSEVEPDGELGSTHASEVVWTDPMVFQTLQKHGWSMERAQRELNPIHAMALLGNMRCNVDETYLPGGVNG